MYSNRQPAWYDTTAWFSFGLPAPFQVLPAPLTCSPWSLRPQPLLPAPSNAQCSLPCFLVILLLPPLLPSLLYSTPCSLRSSALSPCSLLPPHLISDVGAISLKSGHAVSMINADQYRSMTDQISGIDPKLYLLIDIAINTLNLIRH